MNQEILKELKEQTKLLKEIKSVAWWLYYAIFIIGLVIVLASG